MRINIKTQGMLVNEFLTCLERTLQEQGITAISNPYIYFGSDKKIIVASMRKSEWDIEARQQQGFDEVAF